MKKVTIECSEEELWLIERALNFYSRIGIGQFNEITDHPTFDKNLEKLSILERDPVVGDSTPQGKILEIKNGKALINGSVKDGKWDKAQEWKDLKDVKLSCDYGKKHALEDFARIQLNHARNILYGEEMTKNGNWGIYHPKVDDSCRIAYHLYQELRHARYLDRLDNGEQDERRYTVDEYPADVCKIAGMKIPEFKVTIENEQKTRNTKSSNSKSSGT